MHHDLAFVRLPRRQELVTDPAQILRLLLCQWNARLNACMDEGIIADLDHVLDTIQKIPMGTGYVIAPPIRRFIKLRTKERSVGKERDGTCRCGWWRDT